MARRSRRELDIADHLWDCLTRIAEDCGTDRHAVVNQAIYEFARRFNFLTPMAKEVPLPDEAVGPNRVEGHPGGALPPAQEAEPPAGLGRRGFEQRDADGEHPEAHRRGGHRVAELVDDGPDE